MHYLSEKTNNLGLSFNHIRLYWYCDQRATPEFKSL